MNRAERILGEIVLVGLILGIFAMPVFGAVKECNPGETRCGGSDDMVFYKCEKKYENGVLNYKWVEKGHVADECGVECVDFHDCSRMEPNCKDYTCVQACLPKLEEKCYQGDVYYYDSCGNRGDLVETCTQEGCDAGACGGITRYEQNCYKGDVWWYSSTGVKGNKKKDCGIFEECHESGPEAECRLQDEFRKEKTGQVCREIGGYDEIWYVKEGNFIRSVKECGERRKCVDRGNDKPKCVIIDSDNDGIPDSEDPAPNTPGSGSTPETDYDGDGVLNKNDDCPHKAGPKANAGCPTSDLDNDGVPDSVDLASNEAGSGPNGKPTTVERLVHIFFGWAGLQNWIM